MIMWLFPYYFNCVATRSLRFCALTLVGAFFLLLRGNMKLTKEELENYCIYDLRTIAREVGVKAPTVLRKEQLLDEILLILSGEKQPNFTSKRGRPVKKLGIDISKTVQILEEKSLDKQAKEQKIKTILMIIENLLNKLL